MNMSEEADLSTSEHDDTEEDEGRCETNGCWWFFCCENFVS